MPSYDKMHKKFLEKKVHNCRGFSLLEVLLGVTVFMIGMLGVTALNISSLKSNTFAGNMSEAVIVAGDKLEELMTLDYDDLVERADDVDGNGKEQDLNNNGLDDDDPEDGADDIDGIENFGLNDFGPDADYSEEGIGKNSMYDVYWNIAEDEPLENTKRVNVIVRWQIKESWRQINMTMVRVREP
jgi:type IV pilus assembly protein PilV